jgi:ADP-ribosylglycohydrolase
MEPLWTGAGVIDDAELRRRALAVLRGLAVGDAMGAATEGYQPDEVIEVYESPIGEMVEPVNLYPESAPDRIRGVIGPVTESAIEAVSVFASRAVDEEPARLGWSVALGIMSAGVDLDGIVASARRFGGPGPAGAAVAAAIAAGVLGYMARDALSLAVRAATLAGNDALARRIVEAAGAAQGSGGRLVGAVVADVVGPGPSTDDAVAFAFGVAFGTQSIRRAVPQAVNQGGAASLTAGLAGALCGATAPGSAVEAWSNEVEAASGVDLRAVVDQLLALRRGQPTVT